jgi:RHS repeat-associated protein
MWSCKYTYTTWGAAATKQDARGVVTTFSYDAVHRVTQKSYNTSNAPGVASTAAVNYLYDIQMSGTLYSVGTSDYSESYMYDSVHQLTSVTRSNYLNTNYQYNGAGQVTQITYPSGNVFDLSYDSRGRLGTESSESGGGASITGYNIAGQVTGLNLSYIVSESYGYDANRMQLTTQTASRYGTQLLNLTYNYQAQAGQMGALTTAGNAGQLMSVSGTISGTTESANYAYDDLGRLLTSSQTSNGASAQRRFDYDCWGNRTGVWDSTSGGNQIQSVALEQSGGAPTNRIQSVSGGARTNVALAANGATATASSTYGAAFAPSAVINGERKGANWGGDPATGSGWNDATGDFPDWVQVSFNGSKTVNEIDVFTLQDTYWNPSEPTEDMTFTQYGIVDFQVQYWNGSSWQTVPGGIVTGNNKVWRKFTFSNITTDKIRVYITNALATFSRVTEIEAYQPSGVSYAYDAAGNVTSDGAHTYQYDAENRLVTVDSGATAQYAYDYQNRRVKKVAGGNITLYVWEGSHVIAEHDGTVGTYANPGSSPYGVRSCLVDYMYLGSRLVMSRHYTPNCVYQYGYPTICHPTWTDSYYLSDRLSTRLVLDANGNVIGRQGHLPFGEDFGESGTQEKHHFTSYERDGETGTDYAVNRQYSQSMGRFVRVDPFGGSNNVNNPQSLNRYAYVQNDPVNAGDPLGLSGASSIIDLGGGSYAYRICFTSGETSWCEWKVYTEYEPKQGQVVHNPWAHCLQMFKDATSGYKNSGAPSLAQFRIADEAAQAAGVDVATLLVTWWLETSFTANPPNNQGHYGPVQVSSTIAERYRKGTGYTLGQVIGNVSSPKFTGDFIANLTIGGRFLADLVSGAGGDDALAVLQYMNPGLTADQSNWTDADKDRYGKAQSVITAFRKAAECIHDVDKKIFDL